MAEHQAASLRGSKRKRERGDGVAQDKKPKHEIDSVPKVAKESQHAANKARDDKEAKKRLQQKKRRTKKKPDDVNDEDLDRSAGVNDAIKFMDSALLADHIARRTKRYQPEASLVELEDLHVPANAVLDTSSWSKMRVTAGLPDFLVEFSSGDLKKSDKKPGTLHTLVVTGSGIRAADLTRVLRRFETKENKVWKLFAKHIKLEEQKKMCETFSTSIGVGTPQRIRDLLEDGALSDEKLKRIVIDASHIDIKKKGIMDMRETHEQLVKLLSWEKLSKRYGADLDGISLMFY
ncbi:hypothetical protein K402DRAFT_344489 [Aulographum hederae CBS 113979]|uniref:Protein CMS1 n=1 Tax=Aulographum hederae CBS 113979 TaxID=1176131 RepID=A0A6G1HGD7_9PEZI|nr:hypothetical protein K402DRAFT_344489 [Aulographum hederae CBS 113979]